MDMATAATPAADEDVSPSKRPRYLVLERYYTIVPIHRTEEIQGRKEGDRVSED
jgi:hypothetical protein